jgi:ribose transport system ATP-binding protein
MKDAVLLSTKGIRKIFPPTVALNDVNFELRKGEIHGVIGENGSGKSTLSSVIMGVQKPNKGSMYFRGVEYKPESVLDARSKGISMIVQEQNTVSGISVAANIYMGDEDRFVRFGYLNVNRMNREAKKLLDTVEATHIDPEKLIERLSFEDRKLVELARAMYINPELLIVDETTTALTIRGREILYSIMRRMKTNGNSIIFISHDIEEIMEMSDTVTILKDGAVTANLLKEEFEARKIKQFMVGREIADHFYRSDTEPSCEEKVVLEAQNLSQGILKNVSLRLHRGEILGIGGLTECGMHELGKALFGLIKPEAGFIKVNGELQVHNVEMAIQNGIGYVSKNRDTEVLMPVCSIKDNICLVSLRELSRFGIITRKREKRFSSEWISKLNIKASSQDQFCSALSGGNKQKVALAKWLGKNSEILILDCPTRGIDVGVKSAIYELLTELKQEGKSILMISEELPELIGMSDRILILKDGIITGDFARSRELTENKIIEYMI